MAKLKKPISPLDLDQIIDYKDLSLLRSFTTDYGKIVSRRTTGVTRKQQNKSSKEASNVIRLNVDITIMKSTICKNPNTYILHR